MMKHIIIFLLLTCGLSAQTKWRQIERSSVKWRVPAAYDSIPGQTGYASKYIDFTTLMDTVGVSSFAIDSLDYRNDSLLIWVGGGYYFAIIPQGTSGSGGDGEVAYWMQDTLAGDTVHFWDVSNKRLGLNTKTPAALLHVKKNEYALPVAQFENPGTNGQTVLIKHGASSDARYTLTLQTPAATTYFDARGYLGLGVSPSYPLHVYGSNGISRFENTNTNGDAGLDFKNGSKQWRVAMNAEGGSTNNLHFRDVTGSRYPLTLQSSNGYVGVLNLSPARELHVTGRVRVSTLDSDLTPPTTAGTTKMVITDEDGDLSFANIPKIPADSTVVTQGYGIAVTESPTNTYNVKADTSALVTQYDLTASNQTLSNSSTATTHTTTLSNAGGSLVLKEGSNVTLTTSGNEVTIASTGSGGGIDSTNIIGGWGIESTESPANTFNLIADSTQVASQYDLTLKQDKLTNPVTGTGTTNYVSKFTGTSTVGNSQIQDDGSTVGIGGLDAIYKFYQATGDAKIGGTTGYHRLFFGDAQTVYVGEWDLTNRLYLRGGSLAVDINGSRGSNGQVLTSNGASVSWQTPSTASGTVTSVQLAAGTGISLTGTNPITTSGTITVTNSSPNVTTNLSYSNTTSPVTLNSSDGTDVTFTAGSGITLSATGSNMTITNTGSSPPQTWADFNTNIQVWNSTGSYGSGKDVGIGRQPSRDFDVYGTSRLDGPLYSTSNSPGSAGDVLTSNGISAWTWQTPLIYTYGQMSVDGNNSSSLTTTYSKIDFSSSVSSNTTVDVTTNETITVPNTGTYEVSYSVSFNASVAQRYQFRVHVNGTSSARSQVLIDPTDVNDYYTVAKTYIVSLSANDALDLRLRVGTGGSSATGYYESPILLVKRIK